MLNGSIAESEEDLESVHEAMDDLAKSTATKRNRAKQQVKHPEKAVSSCFRVWSTIE